MKARDMNIIEDHNSSLSSSSNDDAKRTIASKRGNGRPPLPRGKVTKKTTKKEGYEKEATDLEDDDISPLKKKKLLGRVTAVIASTPGRPRRRAAAGKKKQYTDTIDSATDGETSNSDESDYGIDKKSQTRPLVVRKANKRKKNPPASPKKTSNAKKARSKRSSPSTKACTDASLAIKNTSGSPYVLSTPKRGTIGLPPIKDSVSKVWKNDGGDWRVSGAIDYGFD